MSPARGFGVAGTLSADVVRVVAPAAERAGYTTWWTNDTPAGDGLAALATAAAHTHRITLAVGVLPLDRWTPERIAGRVEELALPADRLIVGIGAGRQGLRRVEEAISGLRAALDVPIVVGALGPRMRHLAGEVADGALFDWVSPAAARSAAAHVRQAAQRAGRPERLRLAAYVFTALGETARVQLEAEAAYYASLPAYAAHFARMGIAPQDAVIAAPGPDDVRAQVAAYDDPLDETIVRAVPGALTAEAYLQLIAAARPVQPPPPHGGTGRR